MRVRWCALGALAVLAFSLVLVPIGSTPASATGPVPPREQLAAVVTDLQALPDDHHVDKAIEHLQRAIAPALWTVDGTKPLAHGERVFEEMKKAIQDLSAAHDPALGPSINTIATIAMSIVQAAIDEAAAASGVKAKKLDDARHELAKAAKAQARGRDAEMLEHLKDAWRHAREALPVRSLVIDVDWLPAGVPAAVQVAGPKGFSRTITGTTLLTKLQPGSYTVTALPVEANGMRFIPSVDPSQVTVGDDVQARSWVSYFTAVSLKTRVLTSAQLSSVSVGVDVLTWPTGSSPDAEVGDFLVAGVSPATPSGLLVRITAIDALGGQTVFHVATEPGLLLQAVPRGEFSFADGPAAAAAAMPTARSMLALSSEPISNVVDCGAGVNVHISGSFDVTPSYSFSASWGLVSGTQASFTGTITETAQVSISAEAGVSCSKDVTVYEHPFAPVTFMVGPVPVVIVPQLEVKIPLSASATASTAAAVSQTLTVSAGVDYDNGSFTPTSSVQNHFDWDPPTTPGVTLSLEGGLRPQIDLLLYGLVGPYGNVTGSLELEITPFAYPAQPWWTLYGKLSAGAGLTVPLLDLDWGDDAIVSNRWVLAQSTTPPPPPPKTATVTNVESSKNPSNVGESVTFTAHVLPTSGSGTPTGTVTFAIDGADVATQVLSAGSATFATSSLVQGDHEIVATYTGDATFDASTSTTLVQTVAYAGAPTATTLHSSANPAFTGELITFTAVVAPTSGAGTPSGQVSFTIDGISVGNATLTGGAATFETTLLDGSHSVSAAYAGDGVFAPSSSGDLTQDVIGATPMMTEHFDTASGWALSGQLWPSCQQASWVNQIANGVLKQSSWDGWGDGTDCAAVSATRDVSVPSGVTGALLLRASYRVPDFVLSTQGNPQVVAADLVVTALDGTGTSLGAVHYRVLCDENPWTHTGECTAATAGDGPIVHVHGRGAVPDWQTMQRSVSSDLSIAWANVRTVRLTFLYTSWLMHDNVDTVSWDNIILASSP